MDITYTMTVRDWLASYRISASHFRFSLINITIIGVISVVVTTLLVQDVLHINRLWHAHGVFPWHFVETTLVPSLAGGPAVVALSLPLILWLVSERQIVLDELGITLHSTVGKGTIPWKKIVDVAKDGEYLVIGLISGVLIIPQRAFSSAQVADGSYENALYFWRDAKGLPPFASDTPGVWPPAPRPGNSAEPGDSP